MSAAIPTIWRPPRCCSEMNGSPAISSANRVHRAQETQRSRSIRICVLSATGFGKVRLVPVKRDSPRPCVMAWFCSGHSPPLSQTGQSSGWLMSRNSMTPRWAVAATGEVPDVRTRMPSVTGIAHAGCGLGCPSISMRQARQAATGSSSGWSQKRGISMPTCSAARMISVPLGTTTSMPSIATVTRSAGGLGTAGWFIVSVIAGLPPAGPSRRASGRPSPPPCTCPRGTRPGSA